jgi:hypothetical protein
MGLTGGLETKLPFKESPSSLSALDPRSSRIFPEDTGRITAKYNIIVLWSNFSAF